MSYACQWCDKKKTLYWLVEHISINLLSTCVFWRFTVSHYGYRMLKKLSWKCIKPIQHSEQPLPHGVHSPYIQYLQPHSCVFLCMISNIAYPAVNLVLCAQYTNLSKTRRLTLGEKAFVNNVYLPLTWFHLVNGDQTT